MSDAAFGENVTRLFDPLKETHHAMSEDAKLELAYLFGALEAIGTVMDTPPGEAGSEIDPAQIAPIFFTFARHGQRLMEDMRCQFPGKRKWA